MTPVFSTLVEEAIELAAQWHDRTYRKGRWREAPFEVPLETQLRIPVMAHLTMVAFTVQRAGWDDATVAAAFLHDIIEDGNAYRERFRYEELQILMGQDVADLVMEVTEKRLDTKGHWRSWEARKRDYVRHLAQDATPRAIAISLADKLHNAWTMNESLAMDINIFEDGPGRRGLSAGPGKQRWFFRAVLDASRNYVHPNLIPLRDRLREEIERFEQLTDPYLQPQATGAQGKSR